MSKYRIKMISYKKGNGEFVEEYMVQRKVLCWWFNVKIPVIFKVCNGYDIMEISVFGDRKLKFATSSKDSDEYKEVVRNKVKELHDFLCDNTDKRIGLAYWCCNVVYYDKKRLQYGDSLSLLHNIIKMEDTKEGAKKAKRNDVNILN